MLFDHGWQKAVGFSLPSNACRREKISYVAPALAMLFSQL
jgi:hypothetical protein